MEQPTQPFLTRIFRQPPVLFPFVLLFQVVILVFAVKPYFNVGELATVKFAIALGSSLIFLVLWMFICDMRKWAATGYIILTAIILLLQFGFKDSMLTTENGRFYIFDLLMTVFLLFYYKRFR